ncbi:MAG: transpeptidase family protein, partial [Chlorobi bacterium]|nr:transpeptidase family protein [Chlorobiota bacterium]
QLTIDLNYQAIAEEELRKGVQRAGARAGMCIIVQPRTGEILSMANYPVADPNNSASYDSIAWKNRSVIDQFDPGSTFKIVTTSAAIDLGLMDRNDKIYAEEGVLTLEDGTKVRDDHPLGTITVEEALTYSSNIAMVKLARKIGARKMFEYARNFGFGVRTGIDLPVEYSGSLPTPANWDPTTLPRIAFGYGLSATALQIAMAYAAIANNGLLMTPFLVKRHLSHDRTIIEERTSEPKRQVIKPETAAIMREILESVVSKGTGKSAAISGIRIGGKTGTAQKLINGMYTNQKHIASFVGFFPLEDPRILILVVLDEPTNGYYGSAVAAPVFRRIALRLINSTTDFTRTPTRETVLRTSLDFPLPDYTGIPARVGLKWLRMTGLTPVLFQPREMIYNTVPAAGSKCEPGMEVQINRRNTGTEAGGVVMPDVTGLPLRQGVNVLSAAGLKARITGSGVIQNQRPEAGSAVWKGATCMLRASPVNTPLAEFVRVP